MNSHFENAYDLHESDYTVVPYGSRVYRTNKADSDYDYIAIIPENKAKTGEEYLHNNINVHIYNKADFQSQLNEHKVHTLEAYFLKGSLIALLFDFKLDLVKLRHEFSQKSSNSFVKAKKKIEVEKDFYIGWKSLFHSLRILNFGIQIAKTGKIEDYEAANHYWFAIRDAQKYDWDYFKEKYQPEYNRLATEFRKLAPKE